MIMKEKLIMIMMIF